MPENNLIKSITVLSCPHCKEEVFIESQMTPPSISSLFTEKDLHEAKDDCLKRLESVNIDEEKKEDVIRWINDPATVFGPSEVENIILSLLNKEE